MHLFFSPTSPYARKVLVTALEKGLGDRIELLHCNPHAAEPRLLAANPMSQVPTLILDDGQALFDSPVICEWLDEQRDDPRLIPRRGPERWAVLRSQALADGMLDDAYLNVMESRRPESQRSREAMAAREASLLRCVSVLESNSSELTGPLDLAQIAIGCALGYLDFRLPGLEWRKGHADLTDWFDGFARRPSMMRCRPD
jgi:glutathione S-transferase